MLLKLFTPLSPVDATRLQKIYGVRGARKIVVASESLILPS
jgi:hypothetical protein